MITRVRQNLRSISLMTMLLSVTAFAWLAANGIVTAPKTWLVEQSRDAGIVLQRLTITGAEKTKRSDILAVLDVDNGMPMLAMDLTAMREKIEAMPWVKTARISRRLSGELLIEIVERTPFALWQSGGRLALVDNGGTVITRRGLKDYENLLLIVGDQALTATADLDLILQQTPHLNPAIRAAIYVSDRRWDIEFKNGIRVKLPAMGEAYSGLKAWQNFSRLEDKYQLLAREVNVVDLRVKGRLVVSVTDRGRRKIQGQEWAT